MSDGSRHESWHTANEVCAQVESSLGGTLGGTCSETMVHMREPMAGLAYIQQGGRAVEYRYMCGYHAEDPSTCIVLHECGSPRRGEDVLSLLPPLTNVISFSLSLQREDFEDTKEEPVDLIEVSERNHAFAVSQLYQLFDDMRRVINARDTVRRADGILMESARNDLLLLFFVTLVSTMLVCARRPPTVVVDAPAAKEVESVQVAEPHSKV